MTVSNRQERRNQPSAERRSGHDRRVATVHDEITQLSWDDQRSQYFTRLLFCVLALFYFNLGGTQIEGLRVSLSVINLAFAGYAAQVLFFMWHAYRSPHVTWRRRLTMWNDILVTSFAIVVDPTPISPGFLAYLTVILGNGMRYGLRAYAEAVVGSLVSAFAVVASRLLDFVNAISVSAAYFLTFFAITVIYAYSLTARHESGRRKLALERNLDALTGLLNRRALHEHVAHLYRHMDGGTRRLVVLFADLDRFKTVNDTRGHHAGDRVLADIGHLIRGSVRDNDLVARYGGDEFIVVLPSVGLDEGMLVARRLQQAVKRWSGSSDFDVSVSIGLGQFPEHGDDLESVIARVDQAMYRGKLASGGGGILRVDASAPA